MKTITTSTGVSVSLEKRGDDTLVILAKPTAPPRYRRTEAGRLVFEGKGFQPAPFMDGALSAEVLRAIATLIDGSTE